jgi:hypothetical protein
MRLLGVVIDLIDDGSLVLTFLMSVLATSLIP